MIARLAHGCGGDFEALLGKRDLPEVEEGSRALSRADSASEPASHPRTSL